ncbi:hypothetical protein, partial [Dyella jejuensis]
ADGQPGVYDSQTGQIYSYDAAMQMNAEGTNVSDGLDPSQAPTLAPILVTPTADEVNQANANLGGLIDNAYATGQQYIQSAQNGIADGLQSLGNQLDAVPGNVVKELQSLPGQLEQAGSAIMDFVTNPSEPLQAYQAAASLPQALGNDVQAASQHALNSASAYWQNTSGQQMVYDFGYNLTSSLPAIAMGALTGGESEIADGAVAFAESAEGGAGIADSLEVVPSAGASGVNGAGGLDQLTNSLQATTNQAVADLTANPGLAQGLMSPGSYDQLVNGTNLAPASFGKAVERLTAQYVQADPILANQFEYLSQPFVSTPDFAGTIGGNTYTFDITTDASVASHLTRPYGATTTYITYPGLPQGLVFPK